MRAADQWTQIEETLDPDWAEAQLSFTPEGSVADAAAVLGPLQPGRRRRPASAPHHALRTEARSARATSSGGSTGRRIWGTLALVGVIGDVAPAAADAGSTPAQPLADAWDEALSQLPPGLERPPVRARARLERPRPARRAARRAAEPVACTRRDRAALPRVGKAGLRRLAADGAPLLRAHGRRGDHRLAQRSLRALRHGERRDARPGLAPGRSLASERVRSSRDAASCPRGHAGRRGSGAYPTLASFTFHACVPV